MTEQKSSAKKMKIYSVTENKMIEVDKIEWDNDRWQKELTPLQFQITRQGGTETPGSGQFVNHWQPGVYQCLSCGTELFRSTSKFDAGCGWPSFTEPVSELNVIFRQDDRYGMSRTEVLCARCQAHLGHVFDDGPKPTGLRYCINSVAMNFSKDEKKPKEQKMEKATFAAGCFWGVQELFANTRGVISTEAGYSGGHQAQPTYQEVCRGDTGHAEAVSVVFNPDIISYDQLLQIFWQNHDPTTPNRQGPDIGSQYRSVVFYHNEKQKGQALKAKADLQKSDRYSRAIVTEIVPASEFYPAEEYHQFFLRKKGTRKCHI